MERARFFERRISRVCSLAVIVGAFVVSDRGSDWRLIQVVWMPDNILFLSSGWCVAFFEQLAF